MENRIFNSKITIPECKLKCRNGFIVDGHDNTIEKNGELLHCQCYYENKYLDANIGFSYWNVTTDNFEGHPNDLYRIKEYMKNIEQMYKTGQGLYIHGTNGAGKTTLGILLLKYIIHNSKCSVFFAPYSELVILNSRLISGFHDARAEEQINEIKNVDFLMVDDIGKEFEDGKDKSRATLNSLIRFRDMWNKTTIYTGNSPIEDLKAHYGASNYSILEGRSDILTMDYTNDFRKELKHSR